MMPTRERRARELGVSIDELPTGFVTCALCTDGLCPGCADRLTLYYVVLGESARKCAPYGSNARSGRGRIGAYIDAPGDCSTSPGSVSTNPQRGSEGMAHDNRFPQACLVGER